MKKYKKIINNAEVLLLFLAMWLILSESLSVLNIVIGVVVSIFTLIATNKLLTMSYADHFHEPPIPMFIYILITIKDIYTSTWDMIKRIFTNRVDPTFTLYKSELKDQVSLVLLSNSITITPGTISIERLDNEIVVLSAENDSNEVVDSIKGTEEFLLKLERLR